MQTQDEQKKLLLKFAQYMENNHIGKFYDVEQWEEKIESFSKSLSECKRQPVGNNEQGGNNFYCANQSLNKKNKCEEICQICNTPFLQ